MRYLVTGPPGSGKTTWVKTVAKPGDIVWDADAVKASLTGEDPHTERPDLLPLLEAWFDSLARYLRHHNPTGDVYVIRSCADADEADQMRGLIRAHVITLDPGKHVCLARCRDRSPAVAAAIERWYARR